MTAPWPPPAVWVVASRADLCAVCHGAREVHWRRLVPDPGPDVIRPCPHCCAAGGALPLLYLTPETAA